MRHLIITVALLGGLVAGCSSSEPQVPPADSTTVAELDAAVRAASQALLDRPSVSMAVIYFGREDREEINRYEWIDYRSNAPEELRSLEE
jgi:hypothetical protein